MKRVPEQLFTGISNPLVVYKVIEYRGGGWFRVKIVGTLSGLGGVMRQWDGAYFDCKCRLSDLVQYEP